MPLFDAIEADVTAFFVSQGSVLDALIKSLLERVATVENRVQLLRADVTTNLQTIRQQLVSVGAGGTGQFAGVDANAITEAARLAAAGALAAAEAKAAADRQVGDDRAMEMARQLNAVLELVFCAHPAESAVADINAKQAGLARLEDVLRENERILSSLGEFPARDARSRKATSDEESSSDGQDVQDHVEDSIGDNTGDFVGDFASTAAVASRDDESLQSAVVEVIGRDDTPELTPIREEHEHRGAAEAQDERIEEEASVSADPEPGVDHGSESHPAATSEGASTDAVVAGPPGDQECVEECVEKQSERQTTAHRRSDRHERHPSGSVSAQRVHHVRHEGRGTRKKSVYHAYQELQLAEEARLRELQLRDDALLGRVREMLEQSMGQSCQRQDDRQQLQTQLQALAADNERMRAETGELAREMREQSDHQRQAMEEALALHIQQLNELHKRLELELESARLQRAERDTNRREQLIEQQLQDATTQLVAMLEGNAQETAAKMAALEVRVEREFVARAKLDEQHAQWQRTATSNCVFGATPATLVEIQRELEALRSAKASPTTDGEVDAEVLESALDQLAHTLEEALEITRDATDRSSVDEGESEVSSTPQYLSLSAEGLRVMKALRMQLGKVNDLTGRGQSLGGGQQRDPTEEGDSPGHGVLEAALQRMELGTASLLDGCDAQFTRYQEALRSHQGAISQLQQQLRQQTQSEMALRARLALCPSQEDTQRLLQALEDKIAEVASGSASLTAAALAELRAKLTDLPSHELLRRLALDLHGKADRAEMERLRSLLEAQSATGLPAAFLTKSPLRCLSCDQTLFSMPTSPTSRPGSPSSPTRPPPQFHDCQNCQSYTSSPTYADRGGGLFGPQEADDGDVEHLPRVWSSPSFVTATAAPAAATPAADESSDITDDLFAIAAAARQRRQREQQKLAARSPATAQARRAATAGARRSFVNLDDGRNRIPLRRPVLADHIVYGPSIAPHSFRKKLSPPGGPDDDRSARMGAMTPELRAPGGQVIARVTTTTALVRPFAELERGNDRPARQSQVPSQQQQPQRQHRSDCGNR